MHRDVKPANILIAQDGTVKLVDFGLAQVLGTNSFAGGAGTYAYMAPEDFHEEQQSDHQADIWAVGVILYEMLTGRRPFQAVKVKDPFSWKRAVEESPLLPVADLRPDAPPALDAILPAPSPATSAPATPTPATWPRTCGRRSPTGPLGSPARLPITGGSWPSEQCLVSGPLLIGGRGGESAVGDSPRPPAPPPTSTPFSPSPPTTGRPPARPWSTAPWRAG